MTSVDNQQYITIELFNAKNEILVTQIQLANEKLRNEFQEGLSAIQSEIHELATISQINSAKIETLQHTFYWGFAIMATIIALIPYFRKERNKTKQENNVSHSFISEERIREIIAEYLSKTENIGK